MFFVGFGVTNLLTSSFGAPPGQSTLSKSETSESETGPAANIDFSNLRNTLSSIRAYVVESGSMEPAIPVGSLIISQSQPVYSGGDIITFKGGRDNVTTHRVAVKTQQSGETVFYTKGDANEEMDQTTITESQIVGKTIFVLPYLGYAVDFTKQPKGFILLVIIPATIVIYEELRNLGKELAAFFKRLREKHFNKQETSDDTTQERAYPRSAALLPVLAGGFLLLTATGAYFFDSEHSLGNIFQAASTFGQPQPLRVAQTPVIVTPTPTPSPSPEVKLIETTEPVATEPAILVSPTPLLTE